VTDVHSIIAAFRDKKFRAILNNADMATPDGVPIVWALRSFGQQDQQRVYGPDLMLNLCADAERSGYRVFLYGGSHRTLKRLCDKLTAKFPNLKIAGTLSPPYRPLTPREDDEVTSLIRQSQAGIIFVGLGAPKQECWMADHRMQLPNTVMVGVGAAFNFHAGTVKQAPRWMQRSGFEWLFRLGAEPKRLWRRYLFVTPLFLPLWALQKLGLLRMRQHQVDLNPAGD
jgi:N-acetylglucosaminyldiphosphoundecaprenol N-acetyl-beta-D-mannosaminyltransferase